MKKSFFLSFILMFVITISRAQTTAMQLNGLDCNGASHDLFADLDAGKAVVVFFFMPSCGSCPPPAQKIQTMANKILTSYPGMVTAYAMPFQNSTTCSYVSSWVSSNNLTFYAPYDSGATQVAHYGGFGMPTVVLLGGTDHRVMFSTQNFVTSDTTEMRDSILSLFGFTGVEALPNAVSSFTVFPNPANENISIRIDLKKGSEVLIEVTDIAGKQVAVILNEKEKRSIVQDFNTSTLSNGNYLVRLRVNGQSVSRKLNVAH